MEKKKSDTWVLWKESEQPGFDSGSSNVNNSGEIRYSIECSVLVCKKVWQLPTAEASMRTE